MALRGIRNVIIDLGGVIVDLTRSRCIDAFQQLGIRDVRQHILSSGQHKDLFMKYELGYVTTRQFHDEMRRLSQRPLTDEEIDQAWIAMLGEVPTYRLDLLLSLRKRYRTFLLSNTNELHWEWMAQTAFTYQGLRAEDFFDRIYLSYKLHTQKPETRIFEHVLNNAGLHPSETLLLDDSLPNCRTAEAMRMKAYQVKPREDWSFLFR